MLLHVCESFADIGIKISIFLQVREIIDLKFLENFINLVLLQLMLDIANFSNLSKELIHLLIDLVTILTDSAVSDLNELLFEDLEVIIESLHHVYYQWS